MSLLVEHDSLIMAADSELRRFSADPAMRDMERRHKLWLLDHYAGLEAVEAARHEGVVEGEVRGKAEGKVEGKVEGRTEERVDKVLRALDRRMGAVPESLSKQVRQITDTEKLNELFDLALDCKSIEEFAKVI